MTKEEAVSRRKQFFGLALTALAVAIAVSPALGATRPDDRSGPFGAVPAGVATAAGGPPDVLARAVARHTWAPAPAEHVLAAASSSGGFHWLDAGIGAAVGAIGLCALFVVAGRIRRPQRSVAAH